MKILAVHPGADWSTHDVFNGLNWGLKHHGVQVVPYRLDQRMRFQMKALWIEWRARKKAGEDLPMPNGADVQYHASVWAVEMALRHQVDVVLIVSGMFFHLDAIVRLKQAGIKVCVLFTESPYDMPQELRLAAMVDGCWTCERSAVPQFLSVNQHSGYLPHAWHPNVHYPSPNALEGLPSHDVVFVGSGFPERITFFNQINWSGIDLGLYGTWKGLGLKRSVRKYLRADQIENAFAGALYRRAKIGLNLYRRCKGWDGRDGNIAHAESLSPRAYELAACGAFHVSDYRDEVPEIFGDRVPTFKTPQEAERIIREWLARDQDRVSVAAQLPACVAEMSWESRAKTVIGDLQRLLSQSAGDSWLSMQDAKASSICPPRGQAAQPMLSS